MMFRLALALGKTVREIETGMDSAELSEWIAYTNIEPLADPWQIGALQCALMANCWSSGKKRFRVEDFLPKSKTHRQSPKVMRHALDVFAKRHNRKVEGKQDKQGAT